MLIYHYHPDTGNYLGTSLADESPLEPGVFLIPAFATEIEPPETQGEEFAVFAGTAWTIKTPDPEPEPEPEAEPEPTVPLSITPRQGMIVLSRAGLLATVNAAIDSIGGQEGEEARIDFDRANEWRRDWPLLNQLAGGLGLTDEQIDQLFITAATL